MGSCKEHVRPEISEAVACSQFTDLFVVVYYCIYCTKELGNVSQRALRTQMQAHWPCAGCTTRLHHIDVCTKVLLELADLGLPCPYQHLMHLQVHCTVLVSIRPSAFTAAERTIVAGIPLLANRGGRHDQTTIQETTSS